MTKPTVPLVETPPEVRERLKELGANEKTAQLNLYRALANHPEALRGWIELAWRIRNNARTSRRLRELMIIRGAKLMDCEYELSHHREMGMAHGVTEADIEELDNWQTSNAFDDRERAGLLLMEAMLGGSVDASVLETLEATFDPGERVELVVTAGLYSMVPRVLDALRVPLEDED